MRPVDELIESLGSKKLRKLVKKMSKDAYFGFSDLKEELDWSGEDAARVVWALHDRSEVDLAAQPELLAQLSDYAELTPAQTLAEVLGAMTEPHRRGDDDGGGGDEDEDEYEDEYDDEYGDDEYGDDYDDEDDDEDDYEDEDDDEDPYWKDHDGDEEREASLWPDGIDELVMSVSHREPEPFESWESFPPPVRLAMAFVRLRQGRPIPEESKAELLDHLARWHVEEGLSSPMQLVVDGEVTEANLCEGGYDWSRPTEHLERLVATLGGEEAWAKAMVPHAFRLSYRLSARRARPAVLAATPEQLPRMLVAYDAGAEQYREGYAVLVDLRDDSPEDLLAGAERTETKGTEATVADMFRIAAILRLHAAGRPIDPSIDEALNLQGAYFEEYGDRRGYVGLDRIVAALTALGPERTRAILERILGLEYYYAHHAVPALAALPEPDLVARAVEIVAPTMQHVSGHAVHGWAEVGEVALAPLVETFDAREPAKDEKAGERRDALHAAILGVLARMLEQGKAVDPALDRFLLPGESFPNQYHYDMVSKTLVPLLKALPEDRAAAVLRAHFEGSTSPHLERGLALLAELPLGSVIAPAFGALAAGVGSLKEESRVHSALVALKDAAIEHIDAVLPHATPELTRVLGNAWGEHEMARFEDRLPEAETTVQRLQRLAKGHDGPTTTIYVVERDEDTKAGLGRVGDVALGVGEDRWPTHGEDDEPMEHVITLDLRQLPSLRSSFGDAIGVAVFISSRDDNEAYEPDNDEVSFVTVEEADLARGEHDPSGEGDCTALRVTPVEVPVAAFSYGDESLEPLRGAIYQLGGRAGGEPLWLQDEEHYGPFLMQLDESLVHMNLGDAGILYIFEDTAFWQCH